MSRSECPFPAESYDIRASYTRLSKFRACPALGSVSYAHVISGNPADRIITESSDQMIRGRVVHDVLAAIAHHCFTNGVTRDAKALVECYNKALMDHKPPQSVMDTKPTPEELLIQFASSHEFPLLKPDEMWGAERSLWALLTSPSGTRIALEAKIDLFRITGDRAWVNDYKTGFRIMEAEEFRLREMQLPLYFMVLMANYPNVKHGTGTLDWVARDFQQEKTITAESIGRALDFVFLTGDMIADGIKRVRAGESVEEVFPPRPGRACTPFDGVECEAWSQCPYRASGGSLLLDSPQKATETFAEYLVTSTMQRARKGAVSDFAAVNGPVITNGKCLRHKIVDKCEVPNRDAVVRYLYEQGKLDAIQPVASALVEKGEATELAKELAEAGLAQIVQEPSEKIENV